MFNLLSAITFGIVGPKVEVGQRWCLSDMNPDSSDAVIMRVVKIIGNDVWYIWEEAPSKINYKTQNQIRHIYVLMEQK